MEKVAEKYFSSSHAPNNLEQDPGLVARRTKAVEELSQ